MGLIFSNGFEFLNEDSQDLGVLLEHREEDKKGAVLIHSAFAIAYFMFAFSQKDFLDLPYYSFHVNDFSRDGLYIARSLYEVPVTAINYKGDSAKLQLFTYVQIKNKTRECPFAIEMEFEDIESPVGKVSVYFRRNSDGKNILIGKREDNKLYSVGLSLRELVEEFGNVESNTW